ncbi:MAG TPA: hypothetical protein VHW24_08330 [Bryobacteraceae bacterium]|nr:hypothetical protein [Bryobacteraceae bacterium]
MLIIRSEQMRVFEADAEREFTFEMVECLKLHAPRISLLVSETELKWIVETDVLRARSYGLMRRGPISLFLQLTLTLGCGFDTDPQLGWITGILADPSKTDMLRAQSLYEHFAHYSDRVIGIGYRYPNEALRKLRNVDFDVAAQDDWSASRTLEVMSKIYPEKFRLVGEETASALVHSAAGEAKEYGLPKGRGAAALAVMKLVLGHRICQDRYYPRITTALRDPLVSNGADRLKQVVLRAGEQEF